MQRFRFGLQCKKNREKLPFPILFFVFLLAAGSFFGFSYPASEQLKLLRCFFFLLRTFTYKCQNFAELSVRKFQDAYGSFSWKPFFYSVFVNFTRLSASAKSFVNAELHHFKAVFQQSFTELARSFALRLCVCR